MTRSSTMAPRVPSVVSTEPLGAAVPVPDSEAPAHRFETFLREEGDAVLAVVRRFLGNPEDAREVTQEAFLRAFRALPTFRGDASLRTFVTRIALHEATRRLRRRRLRVAIFGLFSSAGRTPACAPPPSSQDATLDLRRQTDALGHALATLPPKQALVLSLRFQEGMTLSEIAESLGVEPETVKTHLTRALRRVRTFWPPPPAKGDTR